MSDALSDCGSDASHDGGQEDVMTPAELIEKLEEVSWIIIKYNSDTQLNGQTRAFPVCVVLNVISVCVSAGLAQWEVLPGAVVEQIGGSGVCDGAAHSHGTL